MNELLATYITIFLYCWRARDNNTQHNTNTSDKSNARTLGSFNRWLRLTN